MLLQWKIVIKLNLGLKDCKENFLVLFCMLAKKAKTYYNYIIEYGGYYSMKELESLKIVNQEGKEVEIKVITILKKPDGSKSFLIYTFDDKADNVDIYASVITENNDTYVLDAITDNEDWELVQKAIKELSEE